MRISAFTRFMWLFAAILAVGLAQSGPAEAANPRIDGRVKAALEELFKAQPQARDFADRAAGILVVPGYARGGLVIGGGYGEGALLENRRIVDYYKVRSGSIGLQLGYQERDQFLMFMSPEALAAFRAGTEFEFAVDASFAVIDTGMGGKISAADFNHPVVVFVNDVRGLMGSLALGADQYLKMEPAAQ
ncbi:MAG TPA: YSC84-related protein [Rhodospirillales bacterium]|nr:YSC84-related protein [Rhodospirillales bacterium]